MEDTPDILDGLEVLHGETFAEASLSDHVVGTPSKPRQSIRVFTGSDACARVLRQPNCRWSGPERAMEPEKANQRAKEGGKEGQA